MIGYTTLGSNDLLKAKAFYGPILELFGAKQVFDSDAFLAWNNGAGSPMFAVMKPYNKEQATAGNGTMIALLSSSPEEVDKLHAKALALGAVNEGDPGPRKGGYYCAYFRDLDGNKLNFYCVAK